jgi:hypothetical protein
MAKVLAELSVRSYELIMTSFLEYLRIKNKTLKFNRNDLPHTV